MKTTLISRLKDVFDELTGKNRFGKPDFVLLKTMMMLAAMDGEIADDEDEISAAWYGVEVKA